ncbi:MAG: GNAT family N-acetyltransferase [Methanobrevibacter sp.]|nr:GNAT family N-acetyltransferase [Methanobrevibacter sp.]
MILKEFDINLHNSYKFAELKYYVDENMYLKLFKDKEIAISAIKDRLKLEIKESIATNSYGKFEKLYALFEEEDYEEMDIKGILILCKGKKQGFWKHIGILFKNLKFSTALKFLLIEIMDYFTLAKYDEEDIYLAELAIDKNQRGRGLGKFLVSSAIEIAKKEGFRKVILDADFKNPVAKKLYESMGFKTFNKSSIAIFGKRRGMYNMEYVIK